jgi:hypothetical protein
MGLQNGLQDLELDIVMGWIGVVFTNVYNPTADQVCHHVIESDRYSGGSRDDLAGIEVTLTVLEMGPLKCCGTTNNESHHKCQPERFSDDPFHFEPSRGKRDLRRVDFFTVRL